MAQQLAALYMLVLSNNRCQDLSPFAFLAILWKPKPFDVAIHYYSYFGSQRTAKAL